jgi:hypothetical protein
MAVPKRLMGSKGDECQCGRRASVIHCNACGSVRVYARLNRWHKCLNGDVRLMETQFRCQSCGHLFIEEEREFCDAPPVTAALALQKMKVLRDAKGTGEYLRPNDEKLAEVVDKLLEENKKKDESKEPQLKPSELNKVQSYIETARKDDVYKTTRLKQVYTDLFNIYQDDFKGKTDQTLESFLAEQLVGFGYNQADIDVVLQWQKERDNGNPTS